MTDITEDQAECFVRAMAEIHKITVRFDRAVIYIDCQHGTFTSPLGGTVSCWYFMRWVDAAKFLGSYTERPAYSGLTYAVLSGNLY